MAIVLIQAVLERDYPRARRVRPFTGDKSKADFTIDMVAGIPQQDIPKGTYSAKTVRVFDPQKGVSEWVLIQQASDKSGAWYGVSEATFKKHFSHRSGGKYVFA